jgi:NAD+ synthase
MFSKNVLAIDAPAVAREAEHAIREQVLGELKRRGAVIGVSGGVDSAVVAFLCARALGPEKVLCLLMPERDSSSDSLRLGRQVVEALGVTSVVEDVGPTLAAAGCYTRQEEAIRRLFPDYAEGWRCKVSLPSLLEGERLNVSRLTVESPSGEVRSARMPLDVYLQLIAATNFKQRARKMMEYYHADRLHYAVAGTPNRLEYDQGFFVKQGDGTADFKPIAHLYKTQVYALAAYLGVPEEIRLRPPSTDTFSLPQTQEEFFFALPYAAMDLCLFAYDHQVPTSEVASAVGLSEPQAERVFKDIAAKRRTTRYLHLPPLTVQPAREA